MSKITNSIKALADFLARPTLLFYALPWLMLLLVLGTVAQRYIGLYQSQKLFFGSFIFWLGVIPLPGAYATIGLIALSLCVKLTLKSPFKKHNTGTIIAHASIIVLLIGGLITASSREEGYMVLAEGQSDSMMSDYHSRELAVLKNDQLILSVPHSDLHEKKKITDTQLPFSVTIDRYCDNCRIFGFPVTPTARGVAMRLSIVPMPLNTEDAKNHAGAIMEVAGAGEKADGVYVTAQSLNRQPEFSIGQDTYTILVRQAERSLPFSLKLIKFEKAQYPGTDIARSYRSEVEVTDGGLKWNKVIEMNEPLRYRGYTFYQSSFVENDGKLFSVLAVVRNSGDVFPYIAITALCIGLLVHLVMRLTRRKAA